MLTIVLNDSKKNMDKTDKLCVTDCDNLHVTGSDTSYAAKEDIFMVIWLRVFLKELSFL